MAVEVKVNEEWKLSAELVPVGVILTYGGSTPPSGFLRCDGSAISRTLYSKLFAVIGEAFGEGDGASTFCLPKLQGQFLRGVDRSAGVDPDAATRTALQSGGNVGDAVGSAQATSIIYHVHNVPNSSSYYSSGLGGGGSSVARYASNQKTNTIETPVNYNNTETRPLNVAVEYIIKY